jgi:tRNA (adenine-N(1)-)-methyltransferase non-catalytic subunit
MGQERKYFFLDRNTRTIEARRLLNDGNFDALIIASKFEPVSVLEVLLPFVAGSRPVVIYDPCAEVRRGHDIFDFSRCWTHTNMSQSRLNL